MTKTTKKAPKKAGKAKATTTTEKKAKASKTGEEKAKASKSAIARNSAANATAEAVARKGKAAKTNVAKLPKRVSALDAAAEVLKSAGKPMRAQELITAMAEQNLWKSPGGKTPHATLYAAMTREERDKGEASRFKKVDRGQFAVNAEGK